LIEVHGVTKRFRGRPAIAGLTFAVSRGQAVGLLGRPGAGRTTTLRLLAGVLDPTSGDVRIAGRDVRSRAARRRLGFLPEGDPVDVDARVHAYLDTMCRLRGVPPSRRRDRVDRALAACGLEEHRRDLVGDLSPGLLRRVGLAQAVVHDPDVLVLDEPAAGLGAAEAGEVLAVVREIGAGRTVVRSCGALSEVGTCDRVLVLREGGLAADDSPSGLRQRLAAAPGRSVVAVVRGDAAGVARRLRRLAGVTGVGLEDIGDGGCRVTVTGGGDQVQDGVARAIVEHGLSLLELSAREPAADAGLAELVLEDVS
jgi:ABC-2 type transport system ATP-binding protein